MCLSPSSPAPSSMPISPFSSAPGAQVAWTHFISHSGRLPSISSETENKKNSEAVTFRVLPAAAPDCTRDNQLPPAKGRFLPSSSKLMAGRGRRIATKHCPQEFTIPSRLIFHNLPLSCPRAPKAVNDLRLNVTVSIPILHWAWQDASDKAWDRQGESWGTGCKIPHFPK